MRDNGGGIRTSTKRRCRRCPSWIFSRSSLSCVKFRIACKPRTSSIWPSCAGWPTPSFRGWSARRPYARTCLGSGLDWITSRRQKSWLVPCRVRGPFRRRRHRLFRYGRRNRHRLRNRYRPNSRDGHRIPSQSPASRHRGRCSECRPRPSSAKFGRTSRSLNLGPPRPDGGFHSSSRSSVKRECPRSWFGWPRSSRRLIRGPAVPRGRLAFTN